MKIKVENIIYKLIPIIILFAFSCASGFVFFYKGYPLGDDSFFHYSHIEDIYISIKRNNYTAISTYITGGIGYGKRLFYSPLSHFSIALFGVILEPFGISLLQSVKIVLFLSIFMSGIFAYLIGMRMTKNRVLSIIIGATYLFMPYKLFCTFERFAIAEAIAIAFVPLFFLGLYDFVHMKELKIKPFIEIIFGALFLYLSHNTTALYSYTAGGIYLIFYFKNIYKLFHDKTTIIFTVVSIVILLGLLSYFLFPTLELYNKDFYNVSDPIRMWTNLDYLKGRASTNHIYSGFLNFDFLNSYYPKYQLYADIIFSTLFASVFIVLCEILKNIKIPKIPNKIYKYIYFIIPTIIYLIASFKVFNHIEAAYASIVLVILYVLYNIIPEIELKDNDISKKNILKDRTFIYSLLMLVITLLFIFIPDMWNIVIKTFYVIQFPFRLFFLVGMYFTLLIGSILKYFNKDKLLSYLSIVSVSFIITMTEANVEKRIEKTKENPSYAYVINEDNILKEKHEVGFNFEYYPKYFFVNDDHKPQYTNSLYYKIKNIISDDYYGRNVINNTQPVFLEGNGEISNYYIHAPKMTFDIVCEEDSYIQVPLIYYPGYEITITNKDNNKEIEKDAKEEDGLISFNLNEGNYKIEINYKGSTIRKLSYAYFMFSIVGLMVFYQVYFYIIIYKKKKDNNIFIQ
jgi:hypothetical protein